MTAALPPYSPTSDDATPPHDFTVSISITIRPAVRDDVLKLEWYGAYASARNGIRRAFIEQMRGQRLMLVADLNGFPVGQVYLQFSASNTEIADGFYRAYLYAFRVIDHLRGCGIGSRLLAAAEAELLARDFKVLMLQVAKTNYSALRLYQRHGYRVKGEEAGIWSYIDHRGITQNVNEPVWVMQKELARP
jgi:ribosomal protein S18 acetylase RimI-like enzyme